jgi:hypothetical protein
MGKVIKLSDYKKGRRKDYLDQYQKRLDGFIHRFVETNFLFDFHEIASNYVSYQAANNEETWDYQDLRELLREAIHESLSQRLLDELKKLSWFDSKFCSIDELTDRCVSYVVLGQAQVASR